jgi:hypothetical protein
MELHLAERAHQDAQSGRRDRGPRRLMDATSQSQLVLRLDARRLLGADGELLAHLGEDERWYTPEGVPCEGLSLPATKLSAHVNPAARAKAQHDADEAWIAGALETIRALATARQTLSADDVWEGIEHPPREARTIGNALSRAHAAGLIEPTADHRPSRRAQNHKRPVRVWRSQIRRAVSAR